jgi:hypothetical protein
MANSSHAGIIDGGSNPTLFFQNKLDEYVKMFIVVNNCFNDEQDIIFSFTII